MRYFDNGCFYTVACSRADVEAFASRWPCFGPAKPMWFQFDRRNGDLVDYGGADLSNDARGVSALADDAKAYAVGRMRR
jgi:hypothetical protein